MKTFAVSTIWKRSKIENGIQNEETRHRLRVINCESPEVAFSVIYNWHVENEMDGGFALYSKLVVEADSHEKPDIET